MSENTESTSLMRVAVEGCGHGTLHAIYAALEESCKAQGWVGGADVLIIGGDFQAVRNKLDLNVTAMPVKYRQMADFHEYYSGTRVAPCLTIFVGGNHEASNHLFELYYGGWVAPNIYYMGAANVLRLGYLRIASLSGIWKGYDYRKPHFERLPYNKDDIQSVYHVRELDARKLLLICTQVDIGISHDWPQGIEWFGDHQELFRIKDLFEADASSGRLGNVAAKQCFDRLRPKYWFSAHLHIKYWAQFAHGEYQPIRPTATNTMQGGPQRLDPASDAANPEPNFIASKHDDDDQTDPILSDLSNLPTNHQESANGGKLLAWQNFHAKAAEHEAAESERLRKQEEARIEEEERSGVSNVAQYQIEETWKQVEVDDEMRREIKSVSKNNGTAAAQPDHIVGYDGCNESKESRAEDDTQPIYREAAQYGTGTSTTAHQAAIAGGSIAQAGGSVVRNNDEIDVEMDDSSSEDSAKQAQTLKNTAEGPPSQTAPKVRNDDEIDVAMDDSPSPVLKVQETSAPAISPATTEDETKMQNLEGPQPVPTEGGSEAVMKESDSINGHKGTQAIYYDPPNGTDQNSYELGNATKTEEDEISPEIRAELAAISSSFKPAQQVQVSASLPLPDVISNTNTTFLALDKCDRNRDFLQLLEVSPISEAPIQTPARPFKLEYDPEWLAIQRVFASDLELGGDPRAPVPQHRGDTYYREKILEEQKWVEKYVVNKGKLMVPENFTITAPVYDAGLACREYDMPREYTNPQTSEYCSLLEIDNKFDITEAEREERVEAGPRKENDRFGGHGRGHGNQRRGRGRGGGGFGGRGGRGGRGGGQRGRGQGRGGGQRW